MEIKGSVPLLILILLVGCTPEPPGPADPSSFPRPCADIYAQDLLPTFEVEITQREWSALLSEYNNWQTREAAGLPIKPYHPAVFRYEKEVFRDARIRLKGNQDYSWVGPKMQFVISFNEVDRAGRLHGVRKLNLDAPWYDPSLLHDRLAFTYLRELYGIPASCANNARLLINGEYYGLYSNIEFIDMEFLRRNFENSRGNLYKYGAEAEPRRGDAYDLERFWATYDIPTLETFVDLEAAVREWAGEAMLPNGDGYWCCSHNFYLYNHPGRGFLFIPFDLDASFDWTPPDVDPLTYPFIQTADLEFTPDESTLGHFGAATAHPFWRARYLDALRAALAAYDVTRLQRRVDLFSTQIAAAAEEDPNRPFTYEEHRAAVKALREFIPQRADYVRDWLRRAR